MRWSRSGDVRILPSNTTATSTTKDTVLAKTGRHGDIEKTEKSTLEYLCGFGKQSWCKNKAFLDANFATTAT
ncbi:hypothetical protein E2C01_100987 [Portunus trituberculatus]|uniref:Uncharacterized protein n=1 Tax=Portunus trituberculatus TaxID=210409 RepID=A0A5B7KKV7_PORTR|nr:hypothetical protein [Portunus trituberculatus]